MVNKPAPSPPNRHIDKKKKKKRKKTGRKMEAVPCRWWYGSFPRRGGSAKQPIAQAVLQRVQRSVHHFTLVKAWPASLTTLLTLMRPQLKYAPPPRGSTQPGSPVWRIGSSGWGLTQNPPLPYSHQSGKRLPKYSDLKPATEVCWSWWMRSPTSSSEACW